MDGVHSTHELVMYLGNTLDDYLSDEFFSLFPVDLPCNGDPGAKTRTHLVPIIGDERQAVLQ
jgi:hypothetical protein